MPRSSAPMRVSARDLEIYRQVTVESKSQRLVAGEHGLSQPRVAAIMKRMKKWSEQPLVPGIDESRRSERLIGLARAHKLRLELYRDLSVEAFRQSQTAHTVKVFLDAEGNKLRQERTGKSAGGTVRFLEFAAKFDARLLAFEGIGSDGSVDLKATNRLPDVPDLTDDEMMEEMEAFIKRMTPVTEAWRAKKNVEAAKAQEAIETASEGASASASARRVQDAVIEAEAVISEQCAKPLSKSLSPVESGNSAVEVTSAGVIAPVMAVISAAKSAVEAASGSVGGTAGPTASEAITADGLEAHPTKAPPPIDEFFVVFRHLLPRMAVDTENPKGKPRMVYTKPIQYDLPEQSRAQGRPSP